MANLIESHFLRVPNELTVTPTVLKRILVVGSCMAHRWTSRLRHMEPSCESDLYLIGNDLPESPAQPIADYDFQIVQLPLRFILPDGAFGKLSQTDHDGHEKLFAHAVNAMRRFLDTSMRWNREHRLLTFVFPFLLPQQNPVGRLMPRYDLRNPVYFVEKLNETLAGDLKEYPNSHFFDLNEIVSTFGRRYIQDDVTSGMNHSGYLSDFDFEYDQGRLETAERATDFFEQRVGSIVAAAWGELVSLFRTIQQTDMVKMVVIDLDDTLWRGVIAELSEDELPTSEGWPKGFWETLSFLKRRGIILAIISKNDEERVVAVWDKILRRQLSLDDFAIRRINWFPKADNMAEILAHVNLLPRNVVYIDDNPAERAGIKAMFPDIRVLGGTPLTWRRILLWSAETQLPEITNESAARTEMVRGQVEREEQRGRLARSEFLASLEVKMALFEVEGVGDSRFGRVLELINKTNQFNTTGKRWTYEECVTALADGTHFYAFDVTDSYTDYGLVGVIVVKDADILQIVMSCRVMGLEIEIAATADVISIMRARGVKEIYGCLVETDRNLPCRDIFSRLGFEFDDGTWVYRFHRPLDKPLHVMAITI